MMKHILLSLITGLTIVFVLGLISAAACVAPVDPPYDFGDAPDSYSTLFADNGASHIITGLYLGSGVDDESDGLPSVLANADVDDGVVFSNIWVQGSLAYLSVTASQPGLLNAWVDFDGHGDWSGTDEQIFTDQTLSAGVNSLSFQVPITALEGDTYARFRLDTSGGLSFTGSAQDGEVEDYRVTINSPVPVPASLVLLGMGLLGFAGLGRKKKVFLK